MPPVRAALSLASLILSWIVLAGCGDPAPADDRPVVAVSVQPQAYVVERVAGEAVRVAVMIPPGASPHSHEPTIRDLREFSKADIYLKVGHPGFTFETAWLDRLLAERSDLAVVDATRGLREALVERGDAAADRWNDDPHVWVSPACVRQMARNTRNALAELLPEARASFDENLKRFEEDIDALEADLAEAFRGLEGEQVHVFHPSWGYLLDAYGLVQVAVECDHKEPSPHELAHVIEEARAHGARVVFVQPQFSEESARAVASEIGGVVAVADPLAHDWLANLRAVARQFRDAVGDGLPPVDKKESDAGDGHVHGEECADDPDHE